MLYLQDVFDALAYGKFSNMAVGKSVTLSITQENQPKVISLINSGLYDIYSRLPLRKKEFTLYQREDISTYYLRPDYVGDVDTGDDEIYIDGTEEDVVDSDIIKLLEAYDADGNEIYINNRKYPDDIFTPELDILKIAPRDPLLVISVVYQASQPLITITEGFDPPTYELYFSRSVLKALLAYVAAEWFVGKTSSAAEGQPSIASTFKYQYEGAMADLEEEKKAVEVDEEAEQFTSNGWV